MSIPISTLFVGLNGLIALTLSSLVIASRPTRHGSGRSRATCRVASLSAAAAFCR